jgi:hypothetical protein
MRMRSAQRLGYSVLQTFYCCTKYCQRWQPGSVDSVCNVHGIHRVNGGSDEEASRALEIFGCFYDVSLAIFVMFLCRTPENLSNDWNTLVDSHAPRCNKSLGYPCYRTLLCAESPWIIAYQLPSIVDVSSVISETSAGGNRRM